jgi:teichuronic acid biosynthesis glycosyltransferase TuaC
MRLLLITSTYPTPDAPNQGIFNGQLVTALSETHTVRVIAPIPWTTRRTRSLKSLRNENVSHPTFYYPPRILRWTYGFWYWISVRRTFQRLVKEFRPDVVLGYWAHPDSDAAVRAASMLSIPSVVMVGGSDVRILARSGRRKLAIQAVLQKAQRVIAFSEDLAKHVTGLGVPLDRIDVVYRGVDRTLFQQRERNDVRREMKIQSDELIVVWVGRLVEVKNPGMAIRAAVQWKQRFGGRFRLIMIGDGPLKYGLQRLIDQLDVTQACTMLGSIPHAQIANWFQAANLTILTSHSEGVPNVLLESIACGTPFVATDVGGVREIADPKLDVLVAAGDETALQTAVIDRLENPTNESRVRSAYDVQELARRVTEVLQRA